MQVVPILQLVIITSQHYAMMEVAWLSTSVVSAVEQHCRVAQMRWLVTLMFSLTAMMAHAIIRGALIQVPVTSVLPQLVMMARAHMRVALTQVHVTLMH
jgi:hypothetical protein